METFVSKIFLRIRLRKSSKLSTKMATFTGVKNCLKTHLMLCLDPGSSLTEHSMLDSSNLAYKMVTQYRANLMEEFFILNGKMGILKDMDF